MASLLQPSYSLLLGSQEWTTQILSLDLRLEAAPLLDVLRVHLPAGAKVSAAVGDKVTLALDIGEKKKVFAGSINSLRRSFSEISITALNAAGELAQYRPAVTYEQITAGTVVRNLCGDIGVAVDRAEDGVSLSFYVADPGSTALEHVARVCAWSGAIARVTAENKIETLVIDATQPEVALKYGRELLELHQGEIASSIDSFVVAGESGAGSHSAPESLRPTTDFFAGNRPEGPASKKRWFSLPALRTAKGAGTAGAALQRMYKTSRKAGTFEAFLQPNLRPGTVFEIQELPAGLQKGPFWLSRVNHVLTHDCCTTRAHFFLGGDSFDPAALLGSLAGAP